MFMPVGNDNNVKKDRDVSINGKRTHLIKWCWRRGIRLHTYPTNNIFQTTTSLKSVVCLKKVKSGAAKEHKRYSVFSPTIVHTMRSNCLRWFFLVFMTERFRLWGTLYGKNEKFFFCYSWIKRHILFIFRNE